MKRLAIITAALALWVGIFIIAAHAEDAKPAPKPTCGATVEECQKIVDATAANAQKKINIYKELLIEANGRFVEQAAK